VERVDTNFVTGWGEIGCDQVPHQIGTRVERVLVVLHSTLILYPAGDIFGGSAFHTNSVPGRRQI